MKWQSALAIYFLFWVMCAFLVAPFGTKTADEAGIEKIPGQADSAPADFRMGRIAARTTLLSALLFAVFYANHVFGWVTADMLPFPKAPA
jgi:predicted secreted protein